MRKVSRTLISKCKPCIFFERRKSSFIFASKYLINMSIINKCFRDSAVSKEIKDVCDSDIFGNIAKAINNHMPKLNQAMNYLTEEDDISMKLRVMTLQIVLDEPLFPPEKAAPQP